MIITMFVLNTCDICDTPFRFPPITILANMASLLARGTRAAASSRLSALRRGFSTTKLRQAEAVPSLGQNNPLPDYHTVEGGSDKPLTTVEFLKETGTPEDAKIRHFTGVLNSLLCCLFR